MLSFGFFGKGSKSLTSTTLTIQPSIDGTPALFAGFPYLRIVTGSAEAAAREFKLVITAIA